MPKAAFLRASAADKVAALGARKRDVCPRMGLALDSQAILLAQSLRHVSAPLLWV
jgi:hypothetical protein